ncbi:MAG TPA: agmatine deiminase [Cyanobacteria bacterium UBA11049]|nr:agmatine deiminase [Cyanobacteria bacterium UBA11049]
MPDEAALHKRTWMAFGANAEIWGEDYLIGVQENIAQIARTIARYEPVVMLVRPEERSLAEQLCGSNVQFLATSLDDVWVRDTGAVFLTKSQRRLAGIDFNFNGWGGKQDHTNDKEVAQRLLEFADAEGITTSIVAEGGAIEVDGQGTAIITESCILNDNRNPGLTKEECDRLLKSLLGVQKIIWLPGIQGKDITDGHTDFYARFARPSVVVVGLEPDPNSFDYNVTREHLKILKTATDAQGRELEVIRIEAPRKLRFPDKTDNFAAGYINFYVINGAVLMPEFGDPEADENARKTLVQLFPEREVVQLNIDTLAAGGGGIHCVTQQEPQAIA